MPPPLTKTCFSPMKLRSNLNIVLKSNFKIMDTHRNNAKFLPTPNLKILRQSSVAEFKIDQDLHDAWFIKRFIRQRLAPTAGPHFSNSLHPANTPVQVHLCNDFIRRLCLHHLGNYFSTRSTFEMHGAVIHTSVKRKGEGCFFL